MFYINKEIESVEVKSNADGTMTIIPNYKNKPSDDTCTPVGVMTRMSIARELQDLINFNITR